jgi:hypothetical protein
MITSTPARNRRLPYMRPFFTENIDLSLIKISGGATPADLINNKRIFALTKANQAGIIIMLS